MKKAYRAFKLLYDNISTVFFVVIIVSVILQVFARYVLRISIPWTEELARYMMAAAAFMGAGTAFRRGDHLGAYFLRDKTTGRLRGAMYCINSAVVIGILLLMFLGALQMRGSLANIKASTMPWFSQAWLYDCAAIGTLVMLVYALRDLCVSVGAVLGKMEITETGHSSPLKEKD